MLTALLFFVALPCMPQMIHVERLFRGEECRLRLVCYIWIKELLLWQKEKKKTNITFKIKGYISCFLIIHSYI